MPVAGDGRVAPWATGTGSLVLRCGGRIVLLGGVVVPSLDTVGTIAHWAPAGGLVPSGGERCPTRRKVYDTVEVRGFWAGCKRRGCSSDWCHKSWRRRTIAGIMAGVGQGAAADTTFWTLTAPGLDTLGSAAALDLWNRDLSERWAEFMRRLRKRFPMVRLEAARVYEYQARGALHVHALIRGYRFLPHAVVAGVASAVGFGFVFVEGLRQGGAAGVAGYLGSYLAKSRQSFPRGARVFGTTRGWALVKRERRVPEVGRYIMAPPEGMTWDSWGVRITLRGTSGFMGGLRGAWPGASVPS